MLVVGHLAPRNSAVVRAPWLLGRGWTEGVGLGAARLPVAFGRGKRPDSGMALGRVPEGGVTLIRDSLSGALAPFEGPLPWPGCRTWGQVGAGRSTGHSPPAWGSGFWQCHGGVGASHEGPAALLEATLWRLTLRPLRRPQNAPGTEGSPAWPPHLSPAEGQSKWEEPQEL